MNQNTAAIIEDTQGNAELQLTIKTLIRESKRRSVLMSAGLAHIMHLEPMIASMEHSKIEELYDQIKKAEAEAAAEDKAPSIVVPEPDNNADTASTSIIDPSQPTMESEAAKAMARAIDYPSTSKIGFNAG